ncbi:MAG TPA: hypothetical protein VIE65_04620 [Methylobacter sp.]|jgi:hypothetical protein
MSQSRIDHLREQLAAVGQEQIMYWGFFKPFSYRLEKELGEYLGDPSCVALSCEFGSFSFDQGSYGHSGIGFRKGKFLVPLMFRLRNLKDEGDTVIRLHVLFTLKGEDIVAEFQGKPPVTTSSSNIAALLDYIYQHLAIVCSKSTWFDEHVGDYQTTNIGFSSRK